MTEEVKPSSAEDVTPAETHEEPVTAASPSSDEDRFVEETLGIPAETPNEEETNEGVQEEKEEPQAEKPKEEAPGATPAEQPEVKPEGKEETAPKEEPKPLFQPTEPTKLDKRIAKLYVNNLVLSGQEDDRVTVESVLKEVAGHSVAEKKAALQNLLSQQKQLRGQRDDGRMSEEDTEALIDAEVEMRMESVKRELAEREWQDDLVKTIESHPELDERTKGYDPVLGAAVEKLVNAGMKASEAYDTLQKSIGSVKERAEKNREKERQRELSGSVTATNPQATGNGKPKDESDKFVEEVLGDFI